MSNSSRQDQNIKVTLKRATFTPIPIIHACPRCQGKLIMGPNGVIKCYASGCGFGLKGNITLGHLQQILQGETTDG